MSGEIFATEKWEKVQSPGTLWFDDAAPPWHLLGQHVTGRGDKTLREWVEQDLGDMTYIRQPNFTIIPVLGEDGQVQHRLAPTGRYSVQMVTTGGEFVGYVDTDVDSKFYIALPGDIADMTQQALDKLGEIAPDVYGQIDLEIMGYLGKSSEIIVPPTSVDWQSYDLADYVEHYERTSVANRFFMTFRLPPIDVLGDRYNLYMVVLVPMDRSGAIQVAVTVVRVVCANTWRIVVDQQNLEKGFKLGHRDGVLSAFQQGIIDVLTDNDKLRHRTLQQLTRFASFRLVESDYETLIAQVFPEPQEPGYTPDAGIASTRARKHELAVTRHNDTLDYLRAAWYEPETFFIGGWDNLAARDLKHTPYHAFNNFTAVLTHARGAGDMVTARQAIGGGERVDLAAKAAQIIEDYIIEHDLFPVIW